MLCNLFWTLPVAFDDKAIMRQYTYTPPTRRRLIVFSFFETQHYRKYYAKYFCFVHSRVSCSHVYAFLFSLYKNKAFISSWNLWKLKRRSWSVTRTNVRNCSTYFFFPLACLVARCHVKRPLSPLWSRVFPFIINTGSTRLVVLLECNFYTFRLQTSVDLQSLNSWFLTSDAILASCLMLLCKLLTQLCFGTFF